MEPEKGLVYDALSLEMLLSVMQAHQQTCELLTTIAGGVFPGFGKRQGKDRSAHSCEGVLWIIEGQVRSSLILSAQSRQVLLEGHLALERLHACGNLSWRIQPLLPLSSARMPGPPEGSDYHLTGALNEQSTPHCLVRFDELPLPSLSHRQRRTVLLVNGQRRISDLSQMLRCPSSQLIPVLRELEQFQLITFAGSADGAAPW